MPAGIPGEPKVELKPHHGVRWFPFVLFLGVALVIWALFWVAMPYVIPEWRKGAQFDMFSAASALFSAFAFSGLIYTIILQRRDLALQLEELQQTRQELKGQKEQLAAQNQTFLRQSFETRFFEWLKLHHEIVNAIRYSESIVGRPSFQSFVGVLRTVYRHLLIEASPAHIRGQHAFESNESYLHRLHAQTAAPANDRALACSI